LTRRLPSAARLARLVLLAELLAGAGAYGLWLWLGAHGVDAGRSPLAPRATAIVLAAGALLCAAIVLRRLVYHASSWEPSFPAALLAAGSTPLLGAWLLRDLLEREVASRPQLAGVALPYRTSLGRMGNTKRLSDL
jgi:hypothetical protein